MYINVNAISAYPCTLFELDACVVIFVCVIDTFETNNILVNHC